MVSNKFEEVFKLFLSQVDDYELSEVDEEDLATILSRHLQNGFIKLYSILEEDFSLNIEASEFSRDITMIEQLMLAKAMKLEWLGEKLNNADLMRKSVGDRDYNAIQGTSYIKELRELYSKESQEVEQMKIDYTYSHDRMNGLIL